MEDQRRKTIIARPPSISFLISNQLATPVRPSTESSKPLTTMARLAGPSSREEWTNSLTKVLSRFEEERRLQSNHSNVDSNPTIPCLILSMLAKKRNVSRRTIARAINDLGYRSRTRGVKHLLTGAMKQVRFERGRHLLNVLKSSRAGQLRFFSDEKIFTVDRVFFSVGEKVNADVYVDVLKAKVIPWMKAKANGREFTFQQDSAPAHTSKKTLKAFEEADVDFWSPKI